MQIEKYRKLKDNRYEVIFSNGLKFKLYDDIIVKYNLLGKEQIDDKLLESIDKANEDLAPYYVSIKYISNKLRSEKEIREYLRKKEYSTNNIESTIDRLKKEGFINNKVYLEAYINDQINLSNNGYYKILNNLVSLGFTEEEITKYLDIIENGIWIEKINKLVNKKIKSNTNYSGNKLKEKIIYELCNLGYSKEIILNELDNYDLNDNQLLEKEYLKIKRKLETKYEGKELNYHIRGKLLAKGFCFDDINNILDE